MTEPEDLEEDLFADLYEDDNSKPTQAAPEIKSELPIANGANPVKDEEPTGELDYNGGGDQQMYNAEQDQDDDDIDFNLGNSTDYSAPTHQNDAHGPGIKEDG